MIIASPSEPGYAVLGFESRALYINLPGKHSSTDLHPHLPHAFVLGFGGALVFFLRMYLDLFLWPGR